MTGKVCANVPPSNLIMITLHVYGRDIKQPFPLTMKHCTHHSILNDVEFIKMSSLGEYLYSSHLVSNV